MVFSKKTKLAIILKDNSSESKILINDFCSNDFVSLVKNSCKLLLCGKKVDFDVAVKYFLGKSISLKSMVFGGKLSL